MTDQEKLERIGDSNGEVSPHWIEGSNRGTIKRIYRGGTTMNEIERLKSIDVNGAIKKALVEQEKSKSLDEIERAIGGRA